MKIDQSSMYVVCALYSTVGTQKTVRIFCTKLSKLQYPITDEFLEVHTDLIHPGPSHFYTYVYESDCIGCDRCDFIYKHREGGNGWGSVLVVLSSEPIVLKEFHPKDWAWKGADKVLSSCCYISTCRISWRFKHFRFTLLFVHRVDAPNCI
jgi:hypothetical protein